MTVWPFDLRGPVFLALFVCAAVWSVVWFVVVRYLGRGPGPSGADPELDGVELAYLEGGFERAVAAEVAGLVHDGRIVETNGRLGVSDDPRIKQLDHRAAYRGVVVDRPPPGLRGAILTTLHGRARSFDALVAQVRDEEQALWARLAARGLLARDLGRTRALALAVPWLVVAVGAIKLGIGIAHDRPVGFLMVLLGIAAMTAQWATRARARLIPPTSRRAAALLARQKDRLLGLETTARVAPEQLTGDDASLAFAAFGTSVLVGSTAWLAGCLPATYHPVPAVSATAATGASSGFGCGSGCSSGGSGCGGGGGCGGCGGCGG